jgi:integrase
VVDSYDFGTRRVKRFKTKRDAEDFLVSKRTELRQRVRRTVNPHITVKDYAALFLDQKAVALDLKLKTRERLRSALKGHVIPVLGDKRMRELDRPAGRSLLEGKLAAEASLQRQRGPGKAGTRRLARGTVLYLPHAVSALMREAVEDQLIVSNPLRGMGKAMNLGKRRRGQRGEIKALTQPQVVRFLTAAREKAPDLFPAFATMALAGLRVGEALALKWENVDLEGRSLLVSEQLGGTPKDGESRSVEMAGALVGILREVKAKRREDALGLGREMSAYALFPEFESRTDAKAEQRVVKVIRRRMQRVLDAAGLPAHRTPHSLRHSFASILVSKGVPIAHVKEALGHTSISMTVDTYGSWLPVEAPGAVNALSEGLPGLLPVTWRPMHDRKY